MAEARPEPVLTIEEIEGSVEVALPGDSAFHVAARGERLRPQSRLRTSAASVLLISHDLALVSRHADRVLVMYGGRVVEAGRDVLRVPRHPYTVGLLAAIPHFEPGRQRVPAPVDVIEA